MENRKQYTDITFPEQSKGQYEKPLLTLRRSILNSTIKSPSLHRPVKAQSICPLQTSTPSAQCS